MTHQLLTTPISYRHHAIRKMTDGTRALHSSDWSRLSHLRKLGLAYGSIHEAGGKVFTLRLGRDALVTITGSDDPTRTMSRRIRRAFGRLGLKVPHFAFAMEVTRDDRNELHLHGAIVLGDLNLKDVKQALRQAGGLISGRAGSRQVQVKKFDLAKGGPVGWAGYLEKSKARTRREVGQDRLTYISSELRRAAAAQWKQEGGGQGAMLA